MRIAYIATGAAGMVCGTCIHDNTLAAALIKKGHEVALIPTYTPIRTDEENISMERVFYGGLNVYLQEKFSIFRKTPAFLDNLLNSPKLLSWISQFSSATSAKDLGTLTVSMLKGEEGNQRKELMKLIQWLKEEYKPDLVHLNHSLIIGFAKEIKNQLGVPVVCGCQGEDLFLDGLVEPYKSQAKALMVSKAQNIDALIATSRYYSGAMYEYLQMEPDRVHTSYLGIKLEGHGDDTIKLKRDKFVIGYLARICPEKGLELLVDAFYKLWSKYGSEKIQLKLAGYLGKKDERFFENVMAKVKARGMEDAVEYLGEIDRLEKIVFLNSIDIFSVPTIYKEPKGLSILEAMANGVPVVQPDHGLFPEIIEKTNGGVLFESENADALAKALAVLLDDPKQREQLGKNGKEAVHNMFGDHHMAESILDIYSKILKNTSVREIERVYE